MASTNLDQLGVRPFQIPNWSLGINTAKDKTEIEDNEAQDILNFEFDASDNLATRAGIVALFSNTFVSRITSLHYFTTDSGEVGVLFTNGSKVWIGQTNGTGVTDLTGALTLPSDTFWQWVTFGGIAIGVNKATSGDNPIKVNTSSVASALGGTPPKGKYITVWNNRVWIVSASAPNQIRACALNTPEDWTTAGDAGTIALDVNPNDGDEITGLHATRETLYVFKRKKTFKIVPINENAAATLASNLQVKIHSNIGCVAANTIQPVLDDAVFLSDLGLASLKLSEQVEDFRTALFSRNVREIQDTPKTTTDFGGVVIDNATQYWLSIPANVSLTGSAQTYVMDYSKVTEGGIIRWTRFDGLAAGSVFTSWVDSTGKIYALGAFNGTNYKIYTYRARDTNRAFSDAGAAYTKQLITKALSQGAPLIRKEYYKWGFGLSLMSTTAQVAIQYYFDSISTKGGSYSTVLSGSAAGARWDTAIWDTDLWDSAQQFDQDIIRRVRDNSSGRRGQTITFKLTNAQDIEAVAVKDFILWASLLTEKGVSEL